MIIKHIGSAGRGLPAGYTEVEYLQSSGTQYIDTGLSASNGFKVSCDVVFNSYNPSNEYNAIVGAQEASSPWKVNFIRYNNILQKFEIPSAGANFNLDLYKKYHIDASTEKTNIYLKVDNVNLVNTTHSLGITNNNVWLFCVNSGGTPVQHSYIKLYNVQLYINDILQRDFVPCYRNSDNVAGLYDIITNIFYINAGTGVFTTGAIIKDYEVLKPRKGSTNIKNVYLGETRVYGVDPSQLVNYTMLYDNGDECTNITGGYGYYGYHSDDAGWTAVPQQGGITRYTNYMYFYARMTSGYGSAIVMSESSIDLSEYKRVMCVGNGALNVNPITSQWAALVIEFPNTKSNNYSRTTGLALLNERTSVNTFSGVKLSNELSLGNQYVGFSMACRKFGSAETYPSCNLSFLCVLKKDNWQQLCTVAGLTPSSYTDEVDLCSNSSAMNTILNNHSAVNYMIRNCTGSFMGAFIASSTALTALNSSTYKTTIQANEHWAKFLAMVA